MLRFVTFSAGTLLGGRTIILRSSRAPQDEADTNWCLLKETHFFRLHGNTVALLRDISRVSLIVEMCSSGIENVPVDAWMLEQRYSMYASKKIRGGGGGG